MERCAVSMEMEWESPGVRHRDLWLTTLDAARVGGFPPLAAVWPQLQEKGEATTSDTVPYEGFSRFRLPYSSLEIQLTPRFGRFYPARILKHPPASAPLFRCIEQTGSAFTADFNDPLGGRQIRLRLKREADALIEHQPSLPLETWRDLIGTGPGMQARFQDSATDFELRQPLARDDNTSDAQFYATPRLLNHVDDWTRSALATVHGRLIGPAQKVLDLMSSMTTHLAPDPARQITGLGMNSEELAANASLSERVVHDLNESPTLPFADQTFDAVICALSVEYLIHPTDVFRQVARVLRPGAPFVVTFSNRCFPTKAIQLWEQVHDFEKIGLVTEYFRLAGQFENLRTLSMRGWPRPLSDRYAGRLLWADPIYCVCGRVRAVG